MILRVIATVGEPTCYHVESATLECVANRRHMFSRRRRPDLVVGGSCPKCDGKLDVRFHKVDIAMYHLNGWCGCEAFAFLHEPKLRKLPPLEQSQGLHRCSHIDAARSFALDMRLRLHERERMVHAGGRREEDQP